MYDNNFCPKTIGQGVYSTVYSPGSYKYFPHKVGDKYLKLPLVIK